MALLGNIIWFIFVGWWSFLLYTLTAGLCFITIIGIPIGKAMFQYGKLMALPFGKVIVKETDIKGVENVSSVRRVGGLIANILWLPFGICFFLVNIVAMIASAITIIGIPNAIVIAKSCKFMLWPVGAKVITKEEWENIRMQKAIKAAYAPMNTPANTQAIAQNANTAYIQQSAQAATPNQTMEHLKQGGAQTLDSLKQGGAQTLDSLKQGGAQTLDSLKENGGKAAATIAATSAAGMSAVQQKRQECTEKAVAKGRDVSLDEILDQLEAKAYKNTAMSWVMTFLEYIAAAILVICMIVGMIYYGSVIIENYAGYMDPSVRGYFILRGALYGIVSTLPVMFVAGVLGMIKRNHIFVAVILGVEELAILLMGIFKCGFKSLTFISLAGVLVWYVLTFITKTQIPAFQQKAAKAENISPASAATVTEASHFCAQCGTKITGSVKFCPKCGADQAQ